MPTNRSSRPSAFASEGGNVDMEAPFVITFQDKKHESNRCYPMEDANNNTKDASWDPTAVTSWPWQFLSQKEKNQPLHQNSAFVSETPSSAFSLFSDRGYESEGDPLVSTDTMKGYESEGDLPKDTIMDLDNHTTNPFRVGDVEKDALKDENERLNQKLREAEGTIRIMKTLRQDQLARSQSVIFTQPSFGEISDISSTKSSYSLRSHPSSPQRGQQRSCPSSPSHRMQSHKQQQLNHRGRHSHPSLAQSPQPLNASDDVTHSSRSTRSTPSLAGTTTSSSVSFVSANSQQSNSRRSKSTKKKIWRKTAQLFKGKKTFEI